MDNRIGTDKYSLNYLTGTAHCNKYKQKALCFLLGINIPMLFLASTAVNDHNIWTLPLRSLLNFKKITVETLSYSFLYP